MKKIIIYIIATIFIMLILFATIDFFRLKIFEMPYFCIKTKNLGPGASAIYRGIGYTIDIYTEYMEDSKIFEIVRYDYKIFGIKLASNSIY